VEAVVVVVVAAEVRYPYYVTQTAVGDVASKDLLDLVESPVLSLGHYSKDRDFD
jgi:hypothetical protein